MMFVGIDVSKKTLDVAFLLAGDKTSNKGRHKVFKNSSVGHEQLKRWIQEQHVVTDPDCADPDCAVHVCLEATGTYAEAISTTLHETGYRVSLVNPMLIRAFGQSQLKRTKTDKADAILIAQFCQMHQPPQWQPSIPEVSELQALVRRLEALEQMRFMEENRLESGVSSSIVRTSLEEHISYLREQVENTRRQIKDHVQQNSGLKVQTDLLESIPGIGEATAALLLAEIGAITQFENARQVAAFAGLVPRIRQSGSSVRSRSRLSKAGSSRLRKALYFPAMVALRFNPVIKAFGLRLSSAGKSKMLIIGAAMRKLLHLAYGVLKSGKAFDPEIAFYQPQPVDS